MYSQTAGDENMRNGNKQTHKSAGQSTTHQLRLRKIHCKSHLCIPLVVIKAYTSVIHIGNLGIVPIGKQLIKKITFSSAM